MKEPKLVNADELKPTLEYVCWIDIMGTKSIMSTSLAIASNFILKFHSYIIKTKKEEKVKYYPLMDGVFITCQELDPLKKVINNIYKNIANIFCKETKFEHKFIIRGALAYGEIINGCNISEAACPEIFNEANYQNILLLGTPMIQAFEAESSAPPFGMYIHELQGRYYKWQGIEKADKLKECACQYFNECLNRYHYLNMDKDKIEFYKELIEEYFLICG